VSEVNTNSRESNQSPKVVWYKSPWLIGWLLLVLIVLAVNAYMIMQSINDFPGLVVDDFYERGQNYEENIQKKLKNNERWVPAFQVKKIHHNKETTILFSISDKTGASAKADGMTFQAKGMCDLLADLKIEDIEVNYPKKIFVED